ncbi:MAG: PH domain-containing protein [Anaerolineales bacterium]|nr:PH domain-containing protein [Anaerolineales bacterium]
MAASYLESLLAQNEKVLRVARQHWTILLRAIVLEIAIILVLFVATTIAGAFFAPLFLAYLLILVPLVLLVLDVLRWWNLQYVVSNRRVIQVSGVFNKATIDSSLEKVNDVKMEQSFFGRVLDYGDIDILTASELAVNRFRRISQPIAFKTAMLNAKEQMGSDSS